MNKYSLSHLPDDVLDREYVRHVTELRAKTGVLLAFLAEFDGRRRYEPAGYSSMFEYCVMSQGMSEGSAYKRIRAARTARRFPALFPAIADGRLHLTAVVLLAAHLTPENSAELVHAATNKTKAAVERLLAERFPRMDMPTLIRPLSPMAKPTEPARYSPNEHSSPALQLSPGTVAPSSASEPPIQQAPLPARAKVTPLSPQRFGLQVTVDDETRELLRRAQALLGHVVPPGDVAEVLKRALLALVRDLEKQKFAAVDHPRAQTREPSGRHIPAQVRREVWRRDGARCTFVGEQGHRCDAKTRLEFDHIRPVSCGGRSTTHNLRLRCRAHNQYEAKRLFGSGFMRSRRDSSKGERGGPKLGNAN